MSWETREYLNQGQDAYANAQAPSRDVESIPDGMYTAEITECSIGESKKDGTPFLLWALRITDGKYAGRFVKRFNQIRIDRPETMGFLKADLAAAGMQLERLPDLPEACADLVGRILDIKLHTKGMYQNCYIRGLVLPNSAAAVHDDDVPF